MTSAREILDNLDFLTVFPSTASRALALAADPTVSLQDFADFIVGDTAVASAVLKLANSPTYQRGRSTSHLGEAVVRLGLRGCSTLVTGLGMCALFRDKDPETVHRCELLWKHSFFTGTLCTELNAALGVGLDGREFTAGFLHDLGRFLIAVALPDEALLADPLDFDESYPGVLEREEELLHTNHCELGKRFCEEQGLPTELAQCIAYHHNPEASDGAHDLVALVSLADALSNHVLRFHCVQDFSLIEVSGYRLLEQSLRRVDSRSVKLRSIVIPAMRKTRELIRALPPSSTLNS